VQTYQSPWIRSHRFEGKVELMDESRIALPFPDTNIIIAAEK
jgi:hypothetical protein